MDWRDVANHVVGVLLTVAFYETENANAVLVRYLEIILWQWWKDVNLLRCD